MNHKYIIALDQGTTSSRASLIDKAGNIIKIYQKEINQKYPQSGWVEHDAEELWSTQNETLNQIFDDIDLDEIAALGITNQRETTILWNRKTGKPVYNAIVWQDRRTASFCNELREQEYEEIIARKTGLILDAYFSATKIRWILDNVKEARGQAEEGLLAFGTVDSWLIYKLTDGASHLTDITNASRTMLYNIHEKKWDEELLSLMHIPSSLLPEVRDCNGHFGTHQGIPINGVAGDQQSALFGQLCLKPGSLKCTYGTGCFLMMNTGDKALKSSNKLLSTIAWSIDGKVTYALEGSVFVGGAVIQWLRDGLGIISESSESEHLASTVEDNGGVYFVPALTGLGAPYWNSNARGMIIGLTRASNQGHICRAAIESIAFQVRDLIEAMISDTEFLIEQIKVDGGAVSNDLLMQFQADILRLSVKRPEVTESTVLGVGYLAGLGSGFWKDIDELKSKTDSDKIFYPGMTEEEIMRKINLWNKAVQKSLDWLDE